MSDQDFKESIIIRKRRSDGEEDHHGGVWKLAFADFMTAMMAFFLVMWLINSTSKETKAAIVQYFNPVQLIDSNPAHKGLRDPKEGGQGSSVQQAADTNEEAGKALVDPKSENREAALHKDPMKALDEIAKRGKPPSKETHADRSVNSGVADPFDRMDQGSLEAQGSRDDASSSQKSEIGARTRQDRERDAVASTNGKIAEGDSRFHGHHVANPPPDKTRTEAGDVIREAIEKAIQQETQGSRDVPRLDYMQTDVGLLISLTDDAKFSMFELGSIEPKPQLVRLLAQIGKALAKQPGDIEIAGHTDGRSYKSKSYDNWRLSTDRATMVNYMLLRGGMPATKVTRISGYADKRLKTPKDPLAAVNRRIDILIRGDRN